ncbi:MAG: hypothetical protein QXW98_04300 [Candidatus Caldarchaeum sp.]
MKVLAVSPEKANLLLCRPLDWSIPEDEALEAVRAVFWDDRIQKVPDWIAVVRLEAEDLEELDIIGTSALLLVDQIDGFAFVVSKEPIHYMFQQSQEDFDGYEDDDYYYDDEEYYDDWDYYRDDDDYYDDEEYYDDYDDEDYQEFEMPVEFFDLFSAEDVKDIEDYMWQSRSSED